MNDWYTETTAAKLRKQTRRCLILLILLLVVGLCACIFLCTRVRTGNASRMLPIIIATSTLFGWAAILLYGLVYRPAKGQAGHIESLLHDSRQVYEGTLSLEKGGFQIPGSILVRKVHLTSPEGVSSFHLNARFVSALPAEGSLVRVTAVRKFILSIEVIGREHA